MPSAGTVSVKLAGPFFKHPRDTWQHEGIIIDKIVLFHHIYTGWTYDVQIGLNQVKHFICQGLGAKLSLPPLLTPLGWTKDGFVMYHTQWQLKKYCSENRVPSAGLQSENSTKCNNYHSLAIINGVQVNSVWPSDIIWWHRSGLTLAQVMASCLTAPSHYLSQCWLLISEVVWHSPEWFCSQFPSYYSL